jgi:hypothetical protein
LDDPLDTKNPLRHSTVEEVTRNGGIWQNSGEHLRLVEKTERIRERLGEVGEAC